MGSARRDSYSTSGGTSTSNRRVASGSTENRAIATDQRRTNTSPVNSRQAVSSSRTYGQTSSSRNATVNSCFKSKRSSKYASGI